MLSLQRPTWFLNGIRDFQVGNGSWWPAGSGGGYLWSHIILWASPTLLLSPNAQVDLRKLFRLFSLPFGVSTFYSRWRWCLSGLYFSEQQAAPIRTSGEGYTAANGVGFRQPVIILQVSLKATSTSRAWAELCHTGHTNSPAEKQRAMPFI